MVNVAGCDVDQFPFLYLGVLAGVSMANISSWDLVLLKFKKKLNRWQVTIMSIGGRLSLFRSLLEHWEFIIFLCSKCLVRLVIFWRRLE